MSGVGAGAVRESASEELIRAEARVVNAHAAERIWLLRCIVALVVLVLVGAAIGNGSLVTHGLLAIATVGAVARSVWRGAKGPPLRGRSSVM